MSRDFGMVTLSYSVALGSKPIQNRFPAATPSPNIEQPALRNLSLLWPSQLLHSLARSLQGLPTGLVQFERSEPNIKILSNLFLDCFPFLFPSTPQHDKYPNAHGCSTDTQDVPFDTTRYLPRHSLQFAVFISFL